MPTEMAIPADASFIGAWFLDDTTVCDRLIEHFRESNEKQQGVIGDRFGRTVIKPEEKDSIELQFDPNHAPPVFAAYVAELQKVVRAYIARFPMCDQYAPWTIVEPTNLQFYPPGGGYKLFHTERTAATSPVNNRHLVFMTYLNDVRDGGETEFFHQNLRVAARRGLTLIWPADWTHTHRGIVSPTEEKIIVTGWFSFYVPPADGPPGTNLVPARRSDEE